MILRNLFGRTGHASTQIIFGAYALSKATQAEADHILYMLLEFGVNHIDTAPMYGNAEKCIGSWMENRRDDFFLATKSRKRTYKGAWEDLQRSLSRLKVDYIDLWQRALRADLEKVPYYIGEHENLEVREMSLNNDDIELIRWLHNETFKDHFNFRHQERQRNTSSGLRTSLGEWTRLYDAVKLLVRYGSEKGEPKL